MTEWQPIETAPRDGMDWLIGFRPDTWGDPKWHCILPMIWFAEGWATPDEAMTSRDDLVGEGLYRFSPTHWMPLPEPPAINNLKELEPERQTER